MFDDLYTFRSTHLGASVFRFGNYVQNPPWNYTGTTESTLELQMIMELQVGTTYRIHPGTTLVSRAAPRPRSPQGGVRKGGIRPEHHSSVAFKSLSSDLKGDFFSDPPFSDPPFSEPPFGDGDTIVVWRLCWRDIF